MRARLHADLRRGVSLVELLVSLVAASLLMAGLSSAMIIALRASDPDLTLTTEIAEGTRQLTEIQQDLQFARSFTETQTRSITATVADRNSDGATETIRYSWSGTPGDPLMRRINQGTLTAVTANVHQFSISYQRTDGRMDYLTVKIRVGSDALAAVQTSILTDNRP